MSAVRKSNPPRGICRNGHKAQYSIKRAFECKRLLRLFAHKAGVSALNLVKAFVLMRRFHYIRTGAGKGESYTGPASRPGFPGKPGDRSSTPCKDTERMKQYVIDQLRGPDYERIRDYLDANAEKTFMEDMYWVNLPPGLYSAVQKEHESCHPFYFAVNLSPTQVDFEFLIRSRQIIRCSCIAYATAKQRDYIMDYADEMIRRLDMKI